MREAGSIRGIIICRVPLSVCIYLPLLVDHAFRFFSGWREHFLGMLQLCAHDNGSQYPRDEYRHVRT